MPQDLIPAIQHLQQHLDRIRSQKDVRADRITTLKKMIAELQEELLETQEQAAQKTRPPAQG